MAVGRRLDIEDRPEEAKDFEKLDLGDGKLKICIDTIPQPGYFAYSMIPAA